MTAPHFTLVEFCASDIAARRGIDNALPPLLAPAAAQTLAMLERIRGYLSAVAGRDIPILLSSGYRCPRLNESIGSKPGSDHIRASAADWVAPAFGTPHEIAKQLSARVDGLGIGQIIYEFDSWIHASWRVPTDAKNRIITINRMGVAQGIQK